MDVCAVGAFWSVLMEVSENNKYVLLRDTDGLCPLSFGEKLLVFSRILWLLLACYLAPVRTQKGWM